MLRPRIFINGKWLAQPTTGTQRYASEIAQRVGQRLPDAVSLVVPRDAVLPEWVAGIPVIRSRFSGHIFEQLVLPLRTFGKYLLNLSGSSPLLKLRQGIVLFDGSMFRYPETFGRAFAAWYRLLYRTAPMRSRHLFTISEFSRSELSDLLHIPPQRLIVARCGADHLSSVDDNRDDQLEADPFVVMIGSLTKRKNLTGVIQAIGARGVRVVVVGASGPSAVFSDTETPVGALVTLAGRLDDAEIAELLSKAIALVFPSLYEGFGLPIVEAQVQGCPVICARTSSLPEVAGDAALFFDADCPEEAADHVVRLLSDSGLRSDLVARGFTNVARFSWDDAANRFVETLG